jgi:hypothetical protein
MQNTMRIMYKNRLAERQFDTKHESTWKYPKVVVTKIKAMKNFIENASSLSDIVHYPPFRFHRLNGDRKYEWGLYLGNTGYRVTVIPVDDQEENIVEGDIIHISKLIKIVLVTEVSNHYE